MRSRSAASSEYIHSLVLRCGVVAHGAITMRCADVRHLGGLLMNFYGTSRKPNGLCALRRNAFTT